MPSRRDFAASLLGAAGWLAIGAPRAARASGRAPDYTLLSDVMVPMRDGVRLSTDVCTSRPRPHRVRHAAIR